MADLRLIFRFIGSSSAPRGALVALPAQQTGLAHARVDALRSSDTKRPRESRKVERGDGPAWPPGLSARYQSLLSRGRGGSGAGNQKPGLRPRD